MKDFFGKALPVIFLCLMTGSAFATSYPLPQENEALIGELQQQPASSEDTIVTIAKKHDLGYNAVANANPTLDTSRNLSYGTSVQLPTQHLLPNEARKGIVVNLPEMRMYYYPKDSNQVLTYPIGIGKIGKMIPIKNTTITRKTLHPNWYPPEDIREFNLAKGIVLPKVMPSGPDNPLGDYAIYTGLPTYLIHSTIFPESIGTRASFGCIRMYEDDIKEFYPTIEKNIPVTIINRPIKMGWEDNRLYMEAHPALEENGTEENATLPGAVRMITETADTENTLIDWQMVAFLTKERDGIPHDIGEKVTSP